MSVTPPADFVATGSIGRLKRVRVSQRMRNVELVLIIFASAINVAALVLVQLGVLGKVDAGPLAICALLAVLVFAIHIAMRFVAPQADALILPIAALLNGLGIAEIYRIDLAVGAEGWDGFATKQIAWSALAMGAALGTIILIRHQRILQRYTYVAGLAAVILILLPMVPGLGLTVNGARVWIQIAGLTFQPGEIAKIALAVFFAGYLVQRRESLSMVGRTFLGMRFPRGRDLGPILVVWALSMSVIVLQRDLGTGLLFFGLFLVMLYTATGRGSWVILGLSLVGLGAVVANQTLDYVNSRFANWYDAFNNDNFNATGGSFQLVQGLFGLAHGGIIGTGLGEGMPEITPVSQSDYIIASLGEELGLAGIFAILCLYLLLVGRGLRIGFAGHDDFSKLLAVGLSFTIALQCFIVIGGVLRVIPLTGLTTPFLAAGGSSLVANWMIAALLLRLSDSIRNEPRLVV
ncbi:cell division protein FtsW [Aurantimicrobium sp. INA4]|uniref:FtsW/RodA/SpoVE family cell cycle protein n=1 Tax=Aurantimicrobium sp. INA4 TaxID=2986279 RepID=UPI00249346C4|nr:FtsW/RodA/SpoVE family cell cycle protein [Aurantimicrobium sp. INA4]BDU10101.1 cell division protein FtsW [Aurantimicrobium sp. INA4]